MIYEFQEVGGTAIIEEHFPMKEAPDLGTIIRRQGKDWRRIMSPPQIDAGVAQKVHGYPYVSNALPRNIKGVPGLQHDAKGRPVILSRTQEKEVCARGGLIRD